MHDESCDPKDIAVKSFFLGPQSENRKRVEALVQQIFTQWFDWRQSLFPEDGCAISEQDKENPQFQRSCERLESTLTELCHVFEQEVPKFSPRYIGHMFSETSVPALLGHIVALLHNPNNVSTEASKVGTLIEDQAVRYLNQMVGFDPDSAQGHFTSGGTVANYEALVRARARLARWLALGALMRKRKFGGAFSLVQAGNMGWDVYENRLNQCQEQWSDCGESLAEFNFVDRNPFILANDLSSLFATRFVGPVVLVPENKHYSWRKGVSLLGLGEDSFWPVKLDRKGHMSVSDLRSKMEQAKDEGRPIMMVVSVAGTTELGEIDPVDAVQDLLDEYQSNEGLSIWHHVDGAYGGFFCSFRDMDQCPLSAESIRSLQALERVNSITLDPHKLGYVPYASGAFLCRELKDYSVKSFGAPYVQFIEKGQVSRGLYTLEGSRSATGATATWLTGRVIGFSADGYGRILARSIQLRNQVEAKLNESGLPLRVAPYGDTNILCFTVAREGEPLSESNARTEEIFNKYHPRGAGPFFVSKTILHWDAYGDYLDDFTSSWGARRDDNRVTLIRLVLMNPFLDSKETKTKFVDEFIKDLSSEIAEGNSKR